MTRKSLAGFARKLTTIRTIRHGGVVTTLAGSGAADGEGSDARFNFPTAVAVDGTGNVYVADGLNVRKVTTVGIVTTIGGSARQHGDADGNGSQARFGGLAGVAVDGMGNIYLADRPKNRIAIGVAR